MSQSTFVCIQMVSSIAIYHFHIVKWFSVMQSNNNNSIRTQMVSSINSSSWPMDGTLTGQSGSGSNGNEVIRHILQSSRTGTSTLDSLTYPGHWLKVVVFYLFAEMQSAYFTDPTNWVGLYLKKYN